MKERNTILQLRETEEQAKSEKKTAGYIERTRVLLGVNTHEHDKETIAEVEMSLTLL